MGLTRRRFIVGLSVGAVWGSLPGIGSGVLGGAAPALAGTAGRTAFDLGTATADTFRPHVGSRFRLQQPGRKALDLVLGTVTAAPPDGGLTDSFSLAFSAARSPGLGQATYALDHAVLGPFQIFLVPAGPQALLAVVNHTRSR